MIIRKAIMDDLETIRNLNQQLFYNDVKFDKALDVNWPKRNTDYFKKKINSKNAATFVAEENGEIIAYLIVSVVNTPNYRTIKKIVEFENMFVIPQERGNGIRTRLINKEIEWAKSKKVRRIRMVASAENIRAIVLYKIIGLFEHDIVLEKKV